MTQSGDLKTLFLSNSLQFSRKWGGTGGGGLVLKKKNRTSNSVCAQDGYRRSIMSVQIFPHSNPSSDQFSKLLTKNMHS